MMWPNKVWSRPCVSSIRNELSARDYKLHFKQCWPVVWELCRLHTQPVHGRAWRCAGSLYSGNSPAMALCSNVKRSARFFLRSLILGIEQLVTLVQQDKNAATMHINGFARASQDIRFYFAIASVSSSPAECVLLRLLKQWCDKA